MKLINYYRQIRAAGYKEEAETLLYLIGIHKTLEEKRELFDTIAELVAEGKLPAMEV